MINELIYVFCISNNSPGLLDHLKSGGINFIVSDDFCAIVKYVSNSEFSEENFRKNLSDIQWVESNAREHINVISRVMEFNTVIPFKFGTIYNSEDGLKKFITDYSGSLAENIHNISGKEEWSVKIYCDRDVLSEKIDELSQEADALEKQIMASSPGKAFLLKKKKTDLVENEIDRLCKNYGQEYYDAFQNLSESSSLNNLLPKEFTGREDTMILNATFLISKNKVTDFKSIAETLKEKNISGFFIEVTGPWPPFSFISIKEKQ
ncbi:MAG: GvpL/GvpF family gas vesicle protein [Bacteroidota bacterium]